MSSECGHDELMIPQKFMLSGVKRWGTIYVYMSVRKCHNSEQKGVTKLKESRTIAIGGVCLF